MVGHSVCTTGVESTLKQVDDGDDEGYLCTKFKTGIVFLCVSYENVFGNMRKCRHEQKWYRYIYIAISG